MAYELLDENGVGVDIEFSVISRGYFKIAPRELLRPQRRYTLSRFDYDLPQEFTVGLEEDLAPPAAIELEAPVHREEGSFPFSFGGCDVPEGHVYDFPFSGPLDFVAGELYDDESGISRSRSPALLFK